MISAILKRVAVITGVLALGAAPVIAATVWGPSRPVYHYNGAGTPGADHVVFNSFDNNPNYGDERTFFDGKDATSTTSGGFQDVVQVAGGEVVTLRTYVHNNADSSLNASGKGIARNTKVSIQLPTGASTSLSATSIISASNATPGSVFDTMGFQNSSTPFSMSYVPGSAVEYTNAVPAGMKLSDSIVSGGAPIGYAKADGNVPGCFQYTAIVTIKVKINVPTISLTKQVTTVGSSNWASNLNAKVGDTDSWLLTYKNTSGVLAKNATVKDVLPAHLQVVPGSVLLVDSLHPNGVAISDTALFGNGQNVGDLAATNGGGYIRFRTIVKNDFDSNVCQATIQNTASAVAVGTGVVHAAATVMVTRPCSTPPSLVCASLAAAPQGGLNSPTYLFTIAKQPATATVTGYVFNFGDGTSQKTDANTNTATHTYAPGTWTATGQVTNAQGTTAVSSTCSVTLTVTSTTPPLPDTGGSALAGVGGLGALGYASRAYLRSRKSLLSSLRRS